MKQILQKRYIDCQYEAQEAVERLGGWVAYTTRSYEQANQFPLMVSFPEATLTDECFLWLADLPGALPHRRAFHRYTLPDGSTLVEPQDTPGYLYLFADEEIPIATKEQVPGAPFPRVTYRGAVKEVIVPGWKHKYAESSISVDGMWAGSDECDPILVRFRFDPVEKVVEAYTTPHDKTQWRLERTNRATGAPSEPRTLTETHPFVELRQTYGIDWQEEIGIAPQA